MRIVERADNPPSKCCVSGFSDGPFIDCDARLGAVDPHIYLNLDVAKQIGRFLGMVDGEEHEHLKAKLAALEETLVELSKELDEAQAFVKAIDVLEREGLKVPA